MIREARACFALVGIQLVILSIAVDSHAAAPPSSADVTLLIDKIGSTAGTPIIDVAVTTSADLCYAGRFESNSGVAVTTTKDDKPPRFHAASISKLFTAVAIMQFRDEGKLSLNDRVGEYIPAFREHKIRLKHLLTHTSTRMVPYSPKDQRPA